MINSLSLLITWNHVYVYCVMLPVMGMGIDRSARLGSAQLWDAFLSFLQWYCKYRRDILHSEMWVCSFESFINELSAGTQLDVTRSTTKGSTLLGALYAQWIYPWKMRTFAEIIWICLFFTKLLAQREMAMSVHSFGPKWNISTTFGWIAMDFGTVISAQRMTPNDIASNYWMICRATFGTHMFPAGWIAITLLNLQTFLHLSSCTMIGSKCKFAKLHFSFAGI